MSDANEADIDATLAVGNGKLVISAAEQQIGSWAVGSIELDLTNRGYRMNANGEHLLVSPVDRFTFRDALETEQSTSRGAGKRRRRKKKAARDSAPSATAPTPSRREIKQAVKDEKKRQASEAKAAAVREIVADPQPEPQSEPDAPKRRFSLGRNSEPAPVSAVLEPETAPAVQPEAPWEVPVESEAGKPERSAFAERLEELPLLWKIGAVLVVAMLVSAVFFPRAVATLLLIPGLLAVMTAGLGLVDPAYTRKLPSQFDEQRLLTWGGVLLGVGLIIVTFF